MPKILYVFEGKEVAVDAPSGSNLLDPTDESGVKMGHMCGGVRACSTCHVWIKKNAHTLSECDEEEQDVLDKAFDVRPSSRLGCQALLGKEDVTVEITPESLRAWYDENPKARHERDEK